MLDTKARRYAEPLFHAAADVAIRLGIKADQTTVAAGITGVTAAICLFCDSRIIALTFLWLSGFLDALDGTVARRTGASSPWGALMDLTLDRLVEMGLILALATRHAQALFPLLLLACAIIFSMTVFLSVGALTPRTGRKAFRYQAGLAERTEGFLLFSLMILFPDRISSLTLLFAALVAFTGCQRLLEARRLLLERASMRGMP